MDVLSETPLRGRGRQRLRSLKLQSQAIALALLDRSIQFKHRRLALLRLKEAVELGAAVNTAQWTYCRRVMTLEQDDARCTEVERAARASRDNRVGKAGPL